MTHYLYTARKGAGYMLNDNRASGGQKQEADIYVCSHCQKLLHADKWKEDGGMCHRCDAPICGPCADRMLTRGCEPWAKVIDRMVEDTNRRKQNARILGI